MLEFVYKFCIIPYGEQERRDSRKVPQSDVTVRKTCRDDAKQIFTIIFTIYT